MQNLEILPESGSLPKDRVLVSNGYRFLIHDNYLMFIIMSRKKTRYTLMRFSTQSEIIPA